jgi:hypothetical protein
VFRTKMRNWLFLQAFFKNTFFASETTCPAESRVHSRLVVECPLRREKAAYYNKWRFILPGSW